jgi:hypothetical protein
MRQRQGAVLAVFVLALLASPARAQSSAPADQGWPRVFSQGDQKVVLYQPQIDSWPDFQQVHFRMAAAVTPSSATQPSYGVVQVQATTSVDKASRTVLVESPQSTVRFPNAPPDQAAQLEAVLRQAVPPKASLTVSLDRMLACMQPSGPQAAGVPVSLDPPKIFYSTQPAILLDFMGAPRVKPIQGTLLMAAFNSNWDVFLDEASGDYFLLDGSHGNTWLTAPDPVAGPWTVAAALPSSFQSLPAAEPWTKVRAALPAPGAPAGPPVQVFASTVPAELIVVQGAPSFEPIEGTKLLAVANTDSALFQHMGDSTWYYLVAGRWFSAPAPAGPWTAATNSLPADFANIPASDPHAWVRESVPGTQAASDAVLLASVPHTATVQRNAVSLQVTYAGAPRFEPIKPTALSYAVNTPECVIQSGTTWFCCHTAVWFTAGDPAGPWSVASSVPAAIYTIPPSSPMYPVTFVRITGSTPDSVTVGYTNGYDGEYVAQTGTLVYGMGNSPSSSTTGGSGDGGDNSDDSGAVSDDDPVYWGSYYPYGPAWYSYGCGAVYAGYAAGCYYRGGAAYGPYYGAARATAYNPATGAWSSAGCRYTPYGSAAYHAGYNPETDTAAARAAGTNAYGSWSRGVVTQGDKWAAGGRETTAAGTAGWVQTSSGAAAAGVKTANNDAWVAKGPEGDVYAGADGNVYQRGDDGSWQQHNGNGWAQPPAAAGATGAQSLDHEASSRQWGNQRASEGSAARSGGGFRGGFRGRR